MDYHTFLQDPLDLKGYIFFIRMRNFIKSDSLRIVLTKTAKHLQIIFISIAISKNLQIIIAFAFETFLVYLAKSFLDRQQ